MCLQKDWYKNVHWSIIHNSYILETTQMPMGRRMNKQTVLYSYNGIPVSNKSDSITNSTAWLSYKHIMLRERSQTQKGTYFMICFHEIREQARLISGDRNQSSDCLWQSRQGMRLDQEGTQGNFLGQQKCRLHRYMHMSKLMQLNTFCVSH